MEFVYGALGMVAVMLLFAAGVFAGWKLKGKVDSIKSKAGEEVLTEQERLERKQDDQAFSSLLGYNVDTAYGVYKNPLDADERR